MGYRTFAVLLDASRNAVRKVSEVKKLIDCMEKMGYNALEIYAEDTYKIDNEPYFGYLRGGYTAQEIKELDAYAAAHGIELIPCIQTLAHFTNLVKLPVYADHVDTADILMIDDPFTYELIEHIFQTLAKNFTSRKVNIGMDEAYNVGLGNYLWRHGYHDRGELLIKHLNKVLEIAEKYGFKAHMWSDMFFRLLQSGDYGGEVPKEILEKVPKNVSLAYWDYFHSDEERYDGVFTQHEKFGCEIWFSGAVRTWHGFAPMLTFASNALRAAMKQVRNHNIENVIVDIWGDNGSECSYLSTLPALYAAKQYAKGNYDEAAIASGFEKLFGVSYEKFKLLEIPNRLPKHPNYDVTDNPCKILLYNDCFLGIFDPALEEAGEIPYGEYAAILKDTAKEMGEYAYLFEELGALCSVLELKAELGLRTRKAYQAGDKKALTELAEDYSETIKRLDVFRKRFYDQWMKENKPYGWEIQEIRLGGLRSRIENCRERLLQYVNGELDKIDELEETLLPHNPNENRIFAWNYRSVVSVSEL